MGIGGGRYSELGGTWHKFIPNPITISIGMALEGGARAPGAPLVPPPMRCREKDAEGRSM